MGYLVTVILLLHPTLACIVLGWMWVQYGWKRKSRELKGEDRKQQLERHERMGERLLQLAILTVLLAFAANMISAIINGEDVLKSLIPGSLHGWTGPVGVTLLWIMARWGKQARNKRLENESFHVVKTKHGRAADLLIACMFMHAFLGFLYLFTVLSF